MDLLTVVFGCTIKSTLTANNCFGDLGWCLVGPSKPGTLQSVAVRFRLWSVFINSPLNFYQFYHN